MSNLLPERYIDLHDHQKNSIEREKFWKWQNPKNVIDKFKSLDNEIIKQKVKEYSLPFAIMMAQVEGDFNFGSLVRSANFLGAREIFYFGKKRWNKVGACGSYLYKDITFIKSIEEIGNLKNGYRLVGLENNYPSVQNIQKYSWTKDKPSLIIVGEESCGIPQDIIALCDDLIEIQGRGSVRSMNAAVAGTLAMYDLINKNFE